MTYATQQNMVDRFGSREVIALTDRDNNGTIDTAVLAEKLAEADNEINAYLGGHFDLPLATVPLIVSGYACDIARYLLVGAEGVETESIRNRYKDAVKFFEKAAKGLVSLGVDATSKQATKSDGVKSLSTSRKFNANTLADY